MTHYNFHSLNKTTTFTKQILTTLDNINMKTNTNKYSKKNTLIVQTIFITIQIISLIIISNL